MPPRNLGGLRTPRPNVGGGFPNVGAFGSTAFRVGVTSDLPEHYQFIKSSGPQIRKKFTAVVAKYQKLLKREMDVQADSVVYGGWEPTRYERTYKLRKGNRVLRLATRLRGNFQLYAYNIAPYAAYVHEGYFVFNTGVYIPPRPWIRIAMDNIEPKFLSELSDSVTEVLTGSDVIRVLIDKKVVGNA